MDASNYNPDHNKLNHGSHVTNRPEINSPLPMNKLDIDPTTMKSIRSAPRIAQPIPLYPDGSIVLKCNQLQKQLEISKKRFIAQIPKNLDLTNIFPENSLNRLSNPKKLSSPMDLIEPALNLIELPNRQEIAKQNFKFNDPNTAQQFIKKLNHNIQPRLAHTRSRSI